MKRFYLKIISLVIVIILLVAACSPKTSEPPYEKFDPNNFDNPTQITNQWLPMTPGTRFTYEGQSVEDDGTVVPHKVVINIINLTKVIGGVRSLVSWDLDYSDGELVEAELAFFSQDNDGTVWRMGEFPVEYDGSEIVATPTWIHGIQDAQAGIMMLANPQIGTPSYAQGWGPAVAWTDRGKVDQLGQETCVPIDCFKGVLVIAETSTSEPDAEQLKYYAPGVGNIRVGWRGGGEKTKETLELVEIKHLDAAALAEVQAKAIEHEKLAYKESKEVYSLTQPMEGSESTNAGGSASSSEMPTTPAATLKGTPDEIVVYAAELSENALFELEIWDDPDSPGGKRIGLVNNGDELDPPPENDPNTTFGIQVRSGVAYRCWIHMKVGAPMGKSQANVFFVAFSDALDKDNEPAYIIRTKSYLTARGPQQEVWSWVGCNHGSEPALVYFQVDGKITVRLQAGMEGVSFDQFLLSPNEYLEMPPANAIVEK